MAQPWEGIDLGVMFGDRRICIAPYDLLAGLYLSLVLIPKRIRYELGNRRTVVP